MQIYPASISVVTDGGVVREGASSDMDLSGQVANCTSIPCLVPIKGAVVQVERSGHAITVVAGTVDGSAADIGSRRKYGECLVVRKGAAHQGVIGFGEIDRSAAVVLGRI